MELSTKERNQLRLFMGRAFDDGDVNDLCFELGINYEDLPGAAKKDKIRELIVYCENRGRLAELLAACRQLRPNVNWPGAAASEPLPPALPTPGAPGGVHMTGTVTVGGDVVGGNKVTYNDRPAAAASAKEQARD